MEVLLLVVAGAFGGVFAVTCRNTTFALVVLVAMFVTRPSIDISGFSLRLENVVGAVAWVRVLGMQLTVRSPPRGLRMLAPVLLLVTWLSLSLVTALTVAREPAVSLSLIAWTFGGLGVAVWIGANRDVSRFLVDSGIRMALMFAILAIICWLAASLGLSSIGVQIDTAYGGYAAYVASIEANLLAGLICLWAVVAIWTPSRILAARLLPWVAPLALVATHTRAALVALLLVIAIALLRRPMRMAAFGFVCILTVSLVQAWTPIAVADQGLGKFDRMLDTREGTGAQRLAVSERALDEWLTSANLLLGSGMNSYGQTHYEPTLPGEFQPAYVGSLPVQLAYDGGIVGLGLILVAGSLVLAKALRVGMHALVVSMGIAYLFLSLANSSLWLLQTWVFVGLGFSLIHSDRTTRNVSPNA